MYVLLINCIVHVRDQLMNLSENCVCLGKNLINSLHKRPMQEFH